MKRSRLRPIFLSLLCIFVGWSCSKKHVAGPGPTPEPPPIFLTVNSPIDNQPDWSPEGKTIAYTHFPQGEPNDSIEKYGSTQIWLLDVSTRTTRYLTWGFSPRWSPDGTKLLVYKGYYDNYLPYTIKANGDSLTPVPVSSNPSFVTWLPDGRRFGLASKPPPPGTTSGLFVMDIDGSNLKRILADPMVIGGEWAKGSYEIVFEKRTGGIYPFNSQHLWLADSSGGNVRPLPADSERAELAPRWSPDGRTIAFYRISRGEVPVQVWSIKRDGSDLKQLTTEGGESPAWAPGGGQIVYCRFDYRTDPQKDARNGRLWIMNADGTNQQQLTFP